MMVFYCEMIYVYLYVFCTLGRGGSAGGKFRISLALPVGAVINCADNTGKVHMLSHIIRDNSSSKILHSP